MNKMDSWDWVVAGFWFSCGATIFIGAGALVGKLVEAI